MVAARSPHLAFQAAARRALPRRQHVHRRGRGVLVRARAGAALAAPVRAQEHQAGAHGGSADHRHPARGPRRRAAAQDGAGGDDEQALVGGTPRGARAGLQRAPGDLGHAQCQRHRRLPARSLRARHPHHVEVVPAVVESRQCRQRQRRQRQLRHHPLRRHAAGRAALGRGRPGAGSALPGRGAAAPRRRHRGHAGGRHLHRLPRVRPGQRRAARRGARPGRQAAQPVQGPARAARRPRGHQHRPHHPEGAQGTGHAHRRARRIRPTRRARASTPCTRASSCTRRAIPTAST